MEDHTMYLDEPKKVRFGINDGLYILFRHKFKILFVFLLVTGAGGFMVYALPAIYESSARIYVNLGRTPLTDDANIDIPQGDASRYALTDIMTLMQGRSVAQDVASIVGVDRVLAPPEPKPIVKDMRSWLAKGREKLVALGVPLPEPAAAGAEEPLDDYARLNRAADRIMAGLNMNGRGGIITIQFTSHDRELAQDTLTALLDVYRQYHIRTVSRSAISPEFYEVELDRLSEELDDITQDYKAFRSANDIVSLTSQLENMLTSIAAVQTSLRDTRGQISATESRLQSFQEQLSSIPEPRSANVGDGTTAGTSVTLPMLESTLATRLRERLFELEAREAELSARYRPGQGLLGDVEKQIAVTRQQLEQVQNEHEAALRAATAQGADPGLALRLPADPTRQNLVLQVSAERANLTGYRSQERSLQRELTDLEQRLASLQVIEGQDEALARRKASVEEAYGQAQRNLERSRMKDILEKQEITEFKVAEPPNTPFRPVGPQKKRNYAVALVAGLMASIGLALLLEILNNTFRTTTDIQRYLDVPVLVTVTRKEFKSCT